MEILRIKMKKQTRTQTLTEMKNAFSELFSGHGSGRNL